MEKEMQMLDHDPTPRELFDLAATDPVKAREAFDALPVERRIEKILSVEGSERLRLIFLSESPEAIVQKMEDEEFYFTIHDIGLPDSLELLQIATPDQLRFLFDLDTWKRDTIDPAAALDHFLLIDACGPEQVERLFEILDTEYLICAFRGFFEIVAREDPEEEPPTSFTIDGQFYFRPKIEEEKFLRVFTALRNLFGTNQRRYYEIVLGILHAIPAEVEEEALRWHEARLEDHAIPSWSEARKLYSTIPLGKIPELTRTPREPSRALSAYVQIPESDSLLARTLRRVLAEPWAADIPLEIVSLLNKEMVARRRNFRDRETLRRSLSIVHDYLNLGLDKLSGGEEDRAVEVIRRTHLLHLFQVGYTLVCQLKQRAELLRKYLDPLGGRWDFLDPPYDVRVQGLWRIWPTYLDWDRKRGEVERNFRSMHDIERVRAEIDHIHSLLELSWRFLSFDPNLRLRLKHRTGGHDLRLSALLATAFARFVLGQSPCAEPITPEQLNAFHRRAIVPDADGGRIAKEWKARFLDEMKARLADGASVAQLDEIASFMEEVWARILEEIGRVDSARGIDPRFVSVILVEHQERKGDR